MSLEEIRTTLKMLADQLDQEHRPDTDMLAYLVDMAKMECDGVIERRGSRPRVKR